jgi:hypothetical protein
MCGKSEDPLVFKGGISPVFLVSLSNHESRFLSVPSFGRMNCLELREKLGHTLLIDDKRRAERTFTSD